MVFRFVVDCTTKGKAYPALAQWQARPYTLAWREFGSHWPYTTPLRLQEYCDQHQVAMEINLPECETKAWYPICLGFFDFGIDYFDLLPEWCVQRLKQNSVKLLFMYHEGDNPVRIKHRLDSLCALHQLATDCYHFITANSKGNDLSNFTVFHDFELWYHQRNLDHPAMPISVKPRSHEFLCLSRVHKSWRATVMADMEHHNILDRSFWSYCQTDTSLADDNPIEIDLIPQLRNTTKKFLERMPKFVDHYTDQQRNDHSLVPAELLEQSYCNIVLESQFDVDGSGGVFLTEKTFKPIKHGQLFFVVGAAGTLDTLRDLGYKVFDGILDNSYDCIKDSTERWVCLRECIQRAKSQGLHQLYKQAIPELKHNQELFQSAPPIRLNSLMQKLETVTW